MTAPPKPPSVHELSYGQCAGWNCVWCGTKLTIGAVSAGIAEGYSGAHDLSVEVFACPDHANGPDRKGDQR
ncbi:hypothetical protein [Streptomyces acidicola]|uniref:hypothetical protein n=1 Tax=Streptomyces acidicola TaxID=2596892 RepID=UPI0034450681